MTKETEKKKKEINNFYFAQTVIVIILITFFLLIRLINKGAFERLFDEYNKYFGEDIPLSVIAENVEGYISDFSSDDSKTPTDDETVTTTEESTSEEKTDEESDDNSDKEESEEETTEESYIKSVSVDDEKISFTEMQEMQVPVQGRISSNFGYRTSPITGEYGLHDGMDIAAPTGTAILAALDGTVIASVESESIGYYIKIDHGNGVVTAYGHCSKLIAKEGDKVKKGELIARVGSTGNSTGPHTHFEVRINGVKVNPAFYLDVSEISET